MSDEFDMTEIHQIFIEESMEGLDIMESGLLNLDPGPASLETVDAIFRAAHSIKGGGGTFGFTEISDFTHHVETLLDEIRQGSRDVTEEAIKLLLESVDCIRCMVTDIQEDAAGKSDQKIKQQADALQDRLSVMLDSDATVAEDSVTAAGSKTEQSPQAGWSIRFQPHTNLLASCNDPQRMIRELAAMGELAIESDTSALPDFADLHPEEIYLGWQLTLLGSIEEASIQEVFAWVEGDCDLELAPLVVESVAEESVAEGRVVADSKPSPAEKAPAKAVGSKGKNSRSSEASSMRVATDKVDAMLNLVGELVITQSMLNRFRGDIEFDPPTIDQLRDGLAELMRHTRELQESVMAIRMLPISFAFNRFPRLVHDLGNQLGKKIELKLSGESTEVDKTVLEKIGDPLVHLVRNALDHGIETPDVRLAAGKPETGVLQLNAFHDGGNIVIEVLDDGAGINQERVLAIARERGIVGAEEELTPEQINNLIFKAGFSTAEEVSDVSGRGVGMDVVRRNINDLGGKVHVESTQGTGSRLTIRLPLTLAILEGQLVKVGNQTYIVPLISIVETTQVTAGSIGSVAGESELFKLRDEYIPVVRLYEVFGIEPESKNLQDGLLVVVSFDGKRVGIFVDELGDQQQVVIKSLEANFRQVDGLSGATILADGKVALIVDVSGIATILSQNNRTGQLAASAAA